MSIADKLTTVAENVPKVFEAGKQAEYDRFWDILQNKGEPANYYYKFSYTGWNEENYNPKYPLVCGTGSTPAMALFYANKDITDTKVPIIVQGSSAQSMFANSDNLVTVRGLTVHEGVGFGSTFVNDYALKNITIEGTIGKSIDFKYSPLTAESAKSVISALKDYSGTDKEYTYSVTFSASTLELLEAEGATAPGGLTWTEYIKAKRWNY